MRALFRPRCLAAALVALAVAGPAPGAGQAVVVGEVVEAESAEPVRGVFVAAVDAAGRQAAGVLTDEAGRFRVRVTEPGRYTLRASRIGFEPVVSASLELGSTPVTYRFELASRPIELAEIRVAGASRRCRVRPEEGTQLQTIWEQVRIALDVASWTQQAGLIQARQRRYERWLDPVSGRVHEESERGRRAYGRTGFAAAPPEELVAEGFVRETEDGGYVFFGLDAATILSDAFLDAHCFRLTNPPRGQEGLVGLAFTPVRGQRVVGVRGVLWLEEATAELRSLEYAYTWLPWRLPSEPFGGEASFRRLPSGEWIVERWAIRMPEVTRVPADLDGSSLTAQALLVRLRNEAGLLIKEEGGEVLSIHTAAGALVPASERGETPLSTRPR